MNVRQWRAGGPIRGAGVSTFYVYDNDALEYLGSVDAEDMDVAGEMARALWDRPMTIVTWRLRLSSLVRA